MPDLPGGSSALPTLYQTMWVTIGARWSGMTTTSMPLSSRKLVTSLSAAGSAAAGNTARINRAIAHPKRRAVFTPSAQGNLRSFRRRQARAPIRRLMLSLAKKAGIRRVHSRWITVSP